MEDKIIEFVKKYSDVEQRTPEWHTARLKTIGGSEISAILGENRFCSKFDIFARKVKLENANVFTGNFATRWGTVFEALICEHFKDKNKATVHGENIFIYDHGDPVSFSPDGIALMNDGKIALLEFKCPATARAIRKPPAYYIPQVLYGLCKIPFCDYGLMVQGKYRRASASDIKQKSGVHADVQPKRCKNYQYGLVVFYGNDDIDYGDISTKEKVVFESQFSKLFDECNHEWIYGTYDTAGNPEHSPADLRKAIFPDIEGKICGYFYWKLVDYSENAIERQDDYVKNNLDLINEVCDDINTYATGKDKDTILSKYMNDNVIEEIIEDEV